MVSRLGRIELREKVAWYEHVLRRLAVIALRLSQVTASIGADLQDPPDIDPLGGCGRLLGGRGLITRAGKLRRTAALNDLAAILARLALLPSPPAMTAAPAASAAMRPSPPLRLRGGIVLGVA